MATGRKHATLPRAVKDQSQDQEAVAPYAPTAAAGAAAIGGPSKRRRVSNQQETPESELMDALEGGISAQPTITNQPNSSTGNRSALLNLSALRTSLSSGPNRSQLAPAGPNSISSSWASSSKLALLQSDAPHQSPPCKAAIPINMGAPQSLQVIAGAGLPELNGCTVPPATLLPAQATFYRPHATQCAAAAAKPPANGLRSLFETFLRSGKQTSNAPGSDKDTLAVELAAVGAAGAQTAAARKPAGAAAAAAPAFWNRAYWNLAAADEGINASIAHLADSSAAAGTAPTAAAQSLAISATTAAVIRKEEAATATTAVHSTHVLQRLLRQQDKQQQQQLSSMDISPAPRAARPMPSKVLQSAGPTAEAVEDPELAVLLCHSGALSSDSTHQDYGAAGGSLASFHPAGAPVPPVEVAGSCMISPAPEALDNSGLDVHLLDATPDYDSNTNRAGLQHAGAGRTPVPWVVASSSATAAAGPAATADGLASSRGLDESHAALLLTACMHEGVVEALAVVEHTDGMPFRNRDGSGSLELLLAYMLVVLQRADMLLKLQEQEPHTLLTMMWMTEAFCSQYRNRLAYVLYDYKFYCKGVPYHDTAVLEVLQADVAKCVDIQKQILINSNFRMWVEEPDMDAACQVLRQAADGAYLAVLDNAILNQLQHLDSQLQLLLRQQAAAQQLQQVGGTSSRSVIGKVSPEFGQEQQTAGPAAAAVVTRPKKASQQPAAQPPRSQPTKQQQQQQQQQGAARNALQDRSNIQHASQQHMQTKTSAAQATKGSSSGMGSKQQLLNLTSKEQALGKRTRGSSSSSRSNGPSENKPPAAAAGAVGGKTAVTRRSTRQSAGATLSSVWSKLLGGSQANGGRPL